MTYCSGPHMWSSSCWDILRTCALQQDTDREVTAEEGENFAKTHGCLFVETSAKADVAVTQAFEELVLKVHSSCSSGSVRPIV